MTLEHLNTSRAASPRLTIGLLIALALGGLVGCVIPQGLEPDHYARQFGAAWSVLRWLFLDRVFTSWWFLGLLFLLLTNLAACVSGSVSRAKRRAQTQGWRAFASPALHAAILLVAVGAILGRVPGLSLRETVVLIEGDESRVRNTEIRVTLRDFWMRFEDQTDTVKTYISEVTFEDETGAAEARIEVNKPANFRGCQFQQVSWGLAGVWLELTSPEGETTQRVLPLREAEGEAPMRTWQPIAGQNHFLIPDSDTAFAAMAYCPEGEFVSTSEGLEVRPTGQYPRRQFVFLKGVTGIESGEHSIEDIGWANEQDELIWQGWRARVGRPVFYSVLGVRRDPGLPFVWTGFMLFTAAMLVMVLTQAIPRARTSDL